MLLRIREIQRVQLEAALAWTVRELDLPAPDGPRADGLARYGARGSRA